VSGPNLSSAARAALLFVLLGSFACDGSRERPPAGREDAGVQDGGPADTGLPPDTGFRTEPFDAGPIDALPQRALFGSWVEVPPGTFWRGSPPEEFGHSGDEDLAEVTLTRGFLMKVTEVTQGEYLEIMGDNPSVNADCGLDCPVGNVSWFDALRFTNALSTREGLQPCYVIDGEDVTFAGLDCEGYRLPTEAEWEYACRSGESLAPFSNGGYPEPIYGPCPEEPAISEVAWYCYNSGGHSHPVGGKPANHWGLLDMHGNADEWVWDWYSGGYYLLNVSRLDPLGPGRPSVTGARVVRGGAYYTGGAISRCGSRSSGQPGSGVRGGGFRPVRTFTP